MRDYIKDALAASFSRTDTAILGTDQLVSVKWLPDYSDEIGFTQEKPLVIYLAWDHPMYQKLTDDEKMTIRFGINGHELLHQLLTDFQYTNQVVGKYPMAERAILFNFLNLLEDPAIEYFAPTQFGGTLLAALKYAIKRLYELSPTIGKEPRAYYQLLNALVEFGDMGIVRGKFTFPEAEEMFRKVAPLFNKGVICPDSKKRIDIGEQIFLMTKPLWEPILKEQEELKKFMNELQKAAQRNSKGNKEAQQQAANGQSGCKSQVSKNRQKTLKQVAQEEAQNDSGSSDNSKGNSDENKSDSEKSESSQEGKGKKSEEQSESDNGSGSSSDEEDSSEESSESSRNSKGSKESKSSDGNSMDQANDDGSSKAKSGKSSKIKSDKSSSEQSQEGANGEPADDGASEEYEEHEMSEGELAELVKNIASELESKADEENKQISKKADTSSGSEIEDIRPVGLGYDAKKLSVSNEKVTSNAAYKDVYQQYCKLYEWTIKKLTKDLAKLLEPEQEAAFRATSGNYNIMRGAVGTSARIFDKRRAPDKNRDVAICLCVDNSGSMSGTCADRSSKIDVARVAAVILTEACTKLNLPLAVMGFSADYGSQVVQRHFVTFQDRNKTNRTSIMEMYPISNNFDGFSIRYATEMLKKRPEAIKILFIISDGQPHCHVYAHTSRAGGYNDTAAAAKDAKKVVNVFGIGLGNCTPETLMSFYGKDFIHCERGSELPNLLGKELTKVLKHALKK